MQEALVVHRETHIPAPPAAVFALLTDPEKILPWMGTEAQVDPQRGGLYLVMSSALASPAVFSARWCWFTAWPTALAGIRGKQRLSAEELLVDRAQLLTLTAPEITVPVGGLRVRRQTDGIS